MICSNCNGAAPLCARCRADRFAQLKGVAACRGEVWADQVAETMPRDRPWPVDGARTAAIALRKVEDLTDDEALRVDLARELVRYAGRRWSRDGDRDEPGHN